MSDVFYLRAVGQSVSGEDVRAMAKDAGGCFDLHRVSWQRSFLAVGGEQMMCWYRSPDAESARIALRELGSDVNAVWSGQIFPGDEEMFSDDVDLLLDVRLSAAVSATEVLPLLQSMLPDASLLAAVLSLDGHRAVGLLHAEPKPGIDLPLAEPRGATSVSVWPCRGVLPAS